VSASTGSGFSEFFQAIDKAAVIYQEFVTLSSNIVDYFFRTYKVDLEKRRAEYAEKEQARQKREFEKLKKDLAGTKISSETSQTENPESLLFKKTSLNIYNY